MSTDLIDDGWDVPGDEVLVLGSELLAMVAMEDEEE